MNLGICASVGGLLMLSLVLTTADAQLSGPPTGAWISVDPNDPGVLNASAFAVSVLASQGNSQFLYRVGSIVQASKQVVAGVNYNITLTVQLTNCSVNSTGSQGSGTQGSGSCTTTSQETCEVIVWVQSWLKPPMMLTNSSCTLWTSLRVTNDVIPGGWISNNITNQGVQNASLFAVGELARRRNAVFLYQVGSILQASSQVVSGINYNITLVVLMTNCPCTEQLYNCTVLTGGSSNNLCKTTGQQICQVIVWTQSWRNPPIQLSSYTCTMWMDLSTNNTPSMFTSMTSAAVHVLPLGALSTITFLLHYLM